MANEKKKEGKKFGLTITLKISILVSVVMVIIAVEIMMVAINSMNELSGNLVYNQLVASANAVEQYYTNIADGGIRPSNDGLYKGTINISRNTTFVDAIKEETNSETVFYFQNNAYVSTIKDAEGNIPDNLRINEDVLKTLNSGEDYYSESYEMNGKTYYGMFLPFRDSGTVVGTVFVGLENDYVDAQIQGYNQKIILYACLILIISVAVAILVANKIASGIKQTVKYMNRLSKGNLTTDIDSKMINRGDEVGRISGAIDKVTVNLRGTVKDIVEVSNSVSNFSGEFVSSFDRITDTIANVNKAADEMANGANTQADETMNANMEVSNMGGVIEETTEKINDLRESSKKMKGYSDEAGETLEELAQINEKARESVDEVQKQTDVTNKSALLIREATTLISDIAEQTNLLSLNASIEAARAGENGRGFAVVANEIRTLADQSTASTERIREIVEQLINNSNESVEIMNDVMNVMNVQHGKLEDTKKMFVELDTEIEAVNDAIGIIKGEMERLDEIKSKVLDSVEHLAAISEENAAGTEETVASMVELTNIIDECTSATKELNKLSDELNNKIAFFKLEK